MRMSLITALPYHPGPVGVKRFFVKNYQKIIALGGLHPSLRVVLFMLSDVATPEGKAPIPYDGESLYCRWPTERPEPRDPERRG